MKSHESSKVAASGRFSPEARALVANVVVYSPAQALFGVFVAAFILRATGNDISKVIAFQLAQFVALPPAAYLNALVRRRFRSATLYSASLVFLATAFLLLTAGFTVDFPFAVGAGLLFGFGSGFLWPNRNALILEALPDAQRNRFYGIEGSCVGVSGVLVPVFAGLFIVSGFVTPGRAYRLLALAAFGLTVLAAALLFRSPGWRFEPPRMRFRLWSSPAWRRFVPFAVAKGVLHFYAYILPALFVAALLGGDEKVLGLVQGAAALVAAAAVFLIGRWTGPESRVRLYAAASVLYGVAAALNVVFRTPLMAVVFLCCLAVAQPSIEFSFCGMEMKVFDRCEADQHGSTCFFLCAFEVAIFIGRLLAALAYFALVQFVPPSSALVVVLAAVGAVQLLSILLARLVTRDARAPVGAGTFE